MKLSSFTIWIPITDGSVLKNTHPAHINGQTERSQHLGTFDCIYLYWSVQSSETSGGQGDVQHKLSRKSHKEHLTSHQKHSVLQPLIAFQSFLLVFFCSILSLYSYTILFWCHRHKSKIWTEAKFSLTSFHILCKILDKRLRKPIVQVDSWHWIATLISPPYSSQMRWGVFCRLPLWIFTPLPLGWGFFCLNGYHARIFVMFTFTQTKCNDLLFIWGVRVNNKVAFHNKNLHLGIKFLL